MALALYGHSGSFNKYNTMLPNPFSFFASIPPLPPTNRPEITKR
jgi:hypothetical protein